MASIPGVPQLSNPVSNAGVVLLGQVESSLWGFLTTETTWGVFNSGSSTSALTVDSVLEMGTHKGAQVSDFKIETGSFASYNKVEKSREVQIRLTKGGTETERSEFLQWFQDHAVTTDKYDLVMPEQTFSGMTLSEYSLRRVSQSGVTLLIADCTFIEIREVGADYYNVGTGQADTSNAASANDVPATPTSKTQTSSYSGTTPSAIA